MLASKWWGREGGRGRRERKEKEGRIGKESKGVGKKIAVLFHMMLIF